MTFARSPGSNTESLRLQAWVWCVRNNVNLHHRREMLDEVLAGPHIDNLAPNVADPSDVRPMSTLDNIVESDASDNEW